MSGIALRLIENNDKLVRTDQGNTFTGGTHDFSGATAVIVPTPTQNSHAAPRSWVEAQIAEAIGVSIPWREVLLDESQIINGETGDPGVEAGIAPAAALVLTEQPANGETFAIERGDGAEALIFTFVESDPGAGEIEIGVSALADLLALAQAINLANSEWVANVRSDLTSIGTSVLVVTRRTVMDADDDGDDRIFGTVPMEYVDFGSLYEAGAADLTAISTTDPNEAAVFGFRRRAADLRPNEGHPFRSGDRFAFFDADGADGAGAWNTKEARSYTAGDGIDLDGTEISVRLAANSGLEFFAGALRAKLKADSGLEADADGLFAKVDASAGTGFDGSGNITTAKQRTIASGTIGEGGTSGDGADTGITASVANSGGHQPVVTLGELSGVGPGLYVANGNGERTTSAFYFSDDNGSSAKAWSAIANGDKLFVNGTVVLGGNLPQGETIRVTGHSLA